MSETVNKILGNAGKIASGFVALWYILGAIYQRVYFAEFNVNYFNYATLTDFVFLPISLFAPIVQTVGNSLSDVIWVLSAIVLAYIVLATVIALIELLLFPIRMLLQATALLRRGPPNHSSESSATDQSKVSDEPTGDKEGVGATHQPSSSPPRESRLPRALGAFREAIRHEATRSYGRWKKVIAIPRSGLGKLLSHWFTWTLIVVVLALDIIFVLNPLKHAEEEANRVKENSGPGIASDANELLPEGPWTWLAYFLPWIDINGERSESDSSMAGPTSDSDSSRGGEDGGRESVAAHADWTVRIRQDHGGRALSQALIGVGHVGSMGQFQVFYEHDSDRVHVVPTHNIAGISNTSPTDSAIPEPANECCCEKGVRNGDGEKPDDEVPQDQAPQDQAPQDQARQDQARQDQVSQDQAPQDQAPQDQVSQDQAPQDQVSQCDCVDVASSVREITLFFDLARAGRQGSFCDGKGMRLTEAHEKLLDEFMKSASECDGDLIIEGSSSRAPFTDVNGVRVDQSDDLNLMVSDCRARNVATHLKEGRIWGWRSIGQMRAAQCSPDVERCTDRAVTVLATGCGDDGGSADGVGSD